MGNLPRESMVEATSGLAYKKTSSLQRSIPASSLAIANSKPEERIPLKMSFNHNQMTRS
ncbi:hypothetical protein ANANG_G00218780 [Anguilla anguilla]|uniref:Uncharacterized protein n=1 Tax=Anguilla anguilla TaxID=7936 RepID=A0A9D3LY43_ANGAN|nr:hypothetical protein ANANG_G00218780 [Anguilla anguilla]